MNWKLLGIEPTKDKTAITAAYRAQLTHTNPEDKPEEFKALRAAYEEALQLAQQADAAPARDESPVGLWMEQVRALYDDFARRIRPENWAELLTADVCTALDTRPQAEEALLRFLMQDFYSASGIEQSVFSEVNFTHAADTEAADDSVFADDIAGLKCGRLQMFAFIGAVHKIQFIAKRG